MYQRTETEIMSSWKGNRNLPLVSICTITYNHEQFIENALDSFLMQKTNFPFEIVIDDDCSTDDNAKIIKTYIDKYPNIINANLRKTNVGMRINSQENLKRAKGKYIALCEGDDYWTDVKKLQKQIDILESNKDVDMCFHKVMQIDMGTQEKLEIGVYLNNDGIVPLEDILLKSRGQIPTASIVLRKSILNDLMAFYAPPRPQYTTGDIFIHFFSTKRGGAYYINQAMSVYRKYSEGSWSSMQRNSGYKNRISGVDSRIEAYEALNTFTKKDFTNAFKKANKKNALIIIKEAGIPYFDRLLFMFKHRKYFSINEKVAYFGLALLPISSYIPKDVYEFLKKLFRMPSSKIKIDE